MGPSKEYMNCSMNAQASKWYWASSLTLGKKANKLAVFSKMSSYSKSYAIQKLKSISVVCTLMNMTGCNTFFQLVSPVSISTLFLKVLLLKIFLCWETKWKITLLIHISSVTPLRVTLCWRWRCDTSSCERGVFGDSR